MTGLFQPWKARVAWALSTIAARTRVRPCDAGLIELLEREAGHPLPAAYVAFLEGAGARVGDFQRGSDVEFLDVRRIQGSFRRLAVEMGAPPVPANAFAFFGHHDYYFRYFLLGKDEDPEVFWFQDDAPEFRCLHRTYSQDLLTLVVESYEVEIPAELM